MIKKIIEKITSAKFIRFFISGVSAFLIDTLVLWVITFAFFSEDTSSLFNIIYLPKLISSSAGLTANFIFNRNWVFSDSKNKRAESQALKFIFFSIFNIFVASIFFSIFLALINYLAVLVGLNITELNKTILLIANLFTEGTKMIISFFAYKYIIFREN